jgi:hypothetical protein
MELVDQQLGALGPGGSHVIGVAQPDFWQMRELRLLREEARKLMKPKK